MQQWIKCSLIAGLTSTSLPSRYPITEVAVLGIDLFVSFSAGSNIAVYDKTTLTLTRNITVPGLSAATNIATDPACPYVYTGEDKTVYQIDPGHGYTVTSWFAGCGGYVRAVAVRGSSCVVTVSCSGGYTFQATGAGPATQLFITGCQLNAAVWLSGSRLLYACSDSLMLWAGGVTSQVSRLANCAQSAVAVSSLGYVLVADSCASPPTVALLSPTLTFIRDLLTSTQSYSIGLDETGCGTLYVAVNNTITVFSLRN